MEWQEGIPRWTQIADDLERRIQEGEYSPGERVPSVLRLMETYGVASATAQKALSGLRARGLTRTDPGIGSTVRKRDP